MVHVPISRRDFMAASATMTLPSPLPHLPPLLPAGSRSCGKHSVFVGIPPADFQPAGPAVIPFRLDHLQHYAGRRALNAAARLAHAFNRAQLIGGAPRWWAVVLFRSKESKKGGA